jgi:hypothetical protein
MSNEKFKVKFGLAVGDTAATVDGTTGNIVTLGDLDLQGGDITNSSAFASTGSSISGTTLTIGTLTSGTITIGQQLTGGTTANGTYITANISGSGSGSTWTVNISQSVSSSSINGVGNIISSANLIASKGSQTTKTAALGGAAVDTNGSVNSILVGAQGVKPASLYVDNTTSGQLGEVHIREYGQNRPGGNSTTSGVPTVWLEAKRGLPSSTGAGSIPVNGGSYAQMRFGGYNGGGRGRFDHAPSDVFNYRSGGGGGGYSEEMATEDSWVCGSSAGTNWWPSGSGCCGYGG